MDLLKKSAKLNERTLKKIEPHKMLCDIMT